jgi:hypothetical protein
MKSKKPAHNRTVYASPPYGGSGYKKTQSGYALCAFFLRHIFAVARIASQFLNRNHKNVIYSRHVMCNLAKKYKKYQEDYGQ